MNYVLKPSLEHIALMKIVVSLWNQEDIKELIQQFNTRLSNEEVRENWLQIEARVVNKIKMLPIPKGVYTEKIQGFIRPIGLEILRWIQYHYEGNGFSVPVPYEFCWTPQGTINKKKTAEVLIKQQNIDITMRYKLACIFCLEEYISVLWREIPEDSKKLFHRDDDPVSVQQHFLVVYWTFIVRKGISQLRRVNFRLRPGCSPYRYAFEINARDGNSVATDFFFQKLTLSELTDCIVRIANSVATVLTRVDSNSNKDYYGEIFMNLLSKMDKNQQNEVFRSNTFQVLRLLLDWPLQHFFMETAIQTWDFLTRELYGQLLLAITKKAVDGFFDFDYEDLFEKYWHESPSAYTEYVARNRSMNVCILLNLYKVGFEKNICLFFRCVTIEEKHEIIYSSGARNICEVLIDKKNYNSLKSFIKECLPMKSDVICLKRSFEEGTLWKNSIFRREDGKWDTFVSLLNDISKSKKKRYAD